MNTFAYAVQNQMTTTTNGMPARVSTSSPVVDLFNSIGASRGKNIIPQFVSALVENEDHAMRIAQWARDIRSGAGERQLFRDILLYLDKNDPNKAISLLRKVPELGRWDDLLLDFTTDGVKYFAFGLIKEALFGIPRNGLVAKWLPRKGPKAIELRKFLTLTPKSYRKLLVNATKVVESQMCAKDWDNINFSSVPSVAASRYKKAFNRHTTKFAEYVASLVKGDDPKVKVNAGAVYPYDVLKGLINLYGITKSYSKTELDHINAQWNALPNYIGDASILPLVDVSGSMTSAVSKSGLTALDVSISLGLYCADKNYGKFKDTFLTFSGAPQLVSLSGDIVQKVSQMQTSNWQMNTNLEAALKKILSVAKSGKVPQKEMPGMLLILSDMQFDSCVSGANVSAIEMMRNEYSKAGYEMPKVVFWNLNAYANVPVKVNETGTALVSGFSPAILKSILSNKLEKFTPENVMLETIMSPRYDWR